MIPDSRLDKLRHLRRRIDDEIRIAEREEAQRARQRANRPADKPLSRDSNTARLEALGVTSRQVKEWAVAAGLLDQVRRGRVASELIDAYAQAEREDHPA